MITNSTHSAEQRTQSQEGADPVPQQACDWMSSRIAENPKSSVLIGLGLGFGAGVVLSTLLTGSSRSSSLPRRIRRQVSDAVREAIPESWADYFDAD